MPERLRTIVGWAIVAYLVGGPFLVQVVGVQTFVVPRWRMYTGFGTDICVVSYTADGQPVDRAVALGYDDASDLPRKQRGLADFEAVHRQSRALCRRLGDVDLRVDARCATRGGWVHVARGGVNACRAGTEDLAEGRSPKRPYQAIQ